MFVEVSGAEFTAIIERMLVGETSICFKVVGNTLYMQAHGAVNHDARLPILSMDAEGQSLAHTALFDKSLTLLNPKLNVRITLNDTILSVTQGTFSYDASQSYEDMIDTRAFDIEFTEDYSINEIKYCVSACKALDLVARTIGMPYATINIKDKNAYLSYSNTAIRVPVRLPDMGVSIETLRRVSTIMSTSKVEKYYSKNDIMYLQYSEDEVISFTIVEPNPRTIEVIEDLITGFREVGTANIAVLSNEIQKIVSIYPKTLLNFGVTDEGVNIFIDSTSAKLAYGFAGAPIYTIRISSAQLSAIQKLFGENVDVSILKGDNKLCLKSKSFGKTLIIAGLVC